MEDPERMNNIYKSLHEAGMREHYPPIGMARIVGAYDRAKQLC